MKELILKHDNQEINFNIPEKYKKIAVNLSGGADSSILLYILTKYIVENNRDIELVILTCVNDLKGRWTYFRSVDVVDKIKKLIPNNIISHHISYFHETQKLEYLRNFEKKLLDSDMIDMVITGLSANPVDIPEELKKGRELIRDVGEHKHNNWYIWNDITPIYFPFRNVDKKFIAYLYDEYDLMYDLFPITRSCEGHSDVTNNFTETCKKCWWCREKYWAFGEY